MRCEKCGEEFEGTGRFCSRSCANSRVQTPEIREKKSKALKGRDIGNHSPESIAKAKATWASKKMWVDWICPHCGKVLRLSSNEAKKRKYCSGTCRNLATNVTKNGSVSKAETILCEILEDAGYVIDRNRRDILKGLEIDIWIPNLQIGIEYNGIYHLQPIHGERALAHIQAKDELKKRLAKQLGIELIVIEDTESNTKKIQTLGKELIEEITMMKSKQESKQ